MHSFPFLGSPFPFLGPRTYHGRSGQCELLSMPAGYSRATLMAPTTDARDGRILPATHWASLVVFVSMARQEGG